MTMKIVKLGVMLLVAFSLSLQAQPQCSNASLNGTLFYTLSGSIKSGTVTVSYTELGKVTADGNGGFSGQTTTSIAGVITTLPVTGNYAIQPNCSGTATLTTTAKSTQLTIQIVNGGSLTLASVAISGVSELAEGRFFRAANATGSQCGNGTLAGTHAALLSGGTYVSGVRTTYEDINQTVFDGKGGLTVTGVVTTGNANGAPLNGSGTYSIAADCSGVAQVNTSNGPINYLLARVEGGTILFIENDANTVISGSANPQLLQTILPQFVFGGGWYTALYFTNTTSTAVSFLVTFTSDAGTPMAVPGVGTSKQVTLAPNSTTIIEALNVGALNQGYASFALPAGVTGYGVFRQSSAGRADQEAVVGFKSATSTSNSLTWDDTNFTTSVAIVNPSSQAVTVTITVWDSSGNLVGTSTQSLPAGSKIENAMRGFLGLAGMANLRGSALFTVPSGNVSVLGLRFGASAFTSIPTTQQQ
jgi:hypothetical protein